MPGYAGRGSVLELGDMQAASSSVVTGVVVTAGVATVTSTSHGLTDNDVVRIDSVGGIQNINDRDHLVRVIDTNDFSLPGSYGISGTYTSGGNVTNLNSSFLSVAGLLTFEDGEEDDEIDVSSIDTALGFREFAAGMVGADFAFTGNTLPNDASYGVINGLYAVKRGAVPVWWRVLMPQVSPVPPARAYYGLLLNLRDSHDAEGKIELTGGGRISRARLAIPGQ